MSDEADWIVLARASADALAMLPGAATTPCKQCGAECVISKSGVEHLKRYPLLVCTCVECAAEGGKIDEVQLVPGAAGEIADWMRKRAPAVRSSMLTIEQAREILERMDPHSTGQFTAEERAAIVRVGAAYLSGEINKDTAARLLRIDPRTGKPLT